MEAQELNRLRKLYLDNCEDLISSIKEKYSIVDFTKTFERLRNNHTDDMVKSFNNGEDIYDDVLSNLCFTSIPTGNDLGDFIFKIENLEKYNKKSLTKTIQRYKNEVSTYNQMILKIADDLFFRNKDCRVLKGEITVNPEDEIYTNLRGCDNRYLSLDDLVIHFYNKDLSEDKKYKINILGEEWYIRVIDRMEDDENIGLCNDTYKTIELLNPNKYPENLNKPYQLRKTIQHEIVHAFAYQSGIGYEKGLTNDEQTTDWFAYQLDNITKLIKPLEKLK